MDERGRPINAHPLTLREGERLSKLLRGPKKTQELFHVEGIIGSHILKIDAHRQKVIWYTKATQRSLHFVADLEIPNGIAKVPPMLWCADRHKLAVYAMKTAQRPTLDTPLYHAPFFNMYADGKVCLGNIDVDIQDAIALETFTASWEHYFFNSYFSHLIDGHNPVAGNCELLWQQLLSTGGAFPKEQLIKSKTTLKQLL
jgi:PRTRC genetic system protein B